MSHQTHIANFESAVRAEIATCERLVHHYSPVVPNAVATAHLPSPDDSTAGLTTQIGTRRTAKMTANEREEMLAERIEINRYHRTTAREYEREYYCALGIAA